VVSITTVATWHTWTANSGPTSNNIRYYRQGNKRVAKRLCDCVSAER